ncbi:cytochrome b/b6 domain-containing protein [Streptomyces sp. AC495_CC817]|uniref:cytochrome b/b6 domain-containing protein n=1 Tax=Streptomyces sp. AC495_CC817 TaxID=2823900 RepID=UPI001C26742E|nr:cytochrome b/b6 domain-containing protein [Streptomyces sp. AC495_CC817]
MATRMLRRGLPRVPGGEPWPPADAVPESLSADVAAEHSAVSVSGGSDVAVSGAGAAAGAPVDAAGDASVPSSSSVSAAVTGERGAGAATAAPAVGSAIRRGLPRVPGGEPWPPADTASAAAAVAGSAPADAASGVVEAASAPSAEAAAAPVAATAPAATSTGAPASAGGAASVDAGVPASGGALRRGLPRVAGGEPWPPAGIVPAAESSGPPADGSLAADAPTETTAPTGAPQSTDLVAARDVSTPLPWTRTVWNGRAPRHVAAAPASGRPRPTWTQAIALLMGAAALGVLAGTAVAFVRTLLKLPFMEDFLAAFPGQYAPAIAVEPGFAPWIGWQHFFNMFLMVLIIRSGLTIRTEKRPTAFWTPRNNPKGKVSLTIWFHQALDILWLVNGVVFVVLLFATGHWVRIVPTSWEVFPNALSAALQYASFDWPHENGWNNYNSLQQLAYFATVFVAAPLAAVTGFRMSGLWPKKAERLSKAYPIEWARAVHFPVMLYFVAFIIAHVALVFLTGFLANLNHMFASSDAVSWTGFWVFVASMVVIALGWVAARPLVIAPIAKAFGTVSGR